jgi:hypothetical protein
MATPPPARRPVPRRPLGAEAAAGTAVECVRLLLLPHVQPEISHDALPSVSDFVCNESNVLTSALLSPYCHSVSLGSNITLH